MEERIDTNDFELQGRLQHKIAVLALRHSRVNHDLADSVQRSLDGHNHNPWFRITTIYLDAAAGDARRDITFSLIIMGQVGQDAEVSETDQQAADSLLVSLQDSNP